MMKTTIKLEASTLKSETRNPKDSPMAPEEEEQRWYWLRHGQRDVAPNQPSLLVLTSVPITALSIQQPSFVATVISGIKEMLQTKNNTWDGKIQMQSKASILQYSAQWQLWSMDLPWSKQIEQLHLSPPQPLRIPNAITEYEVPCDEENHLAHNEGKTSASKRSVALDAKLKTQMKICKLKTDLHMVQCKLLNKSKDLKSSHRWTQHLEAQVKLLCSMKENSKPATLTNGVTMAINMMVNPKYGIRHLAGG